MYVRKSPLSLLTIHMERLNNIYKIELSRAPQIRPMHLKECCVVKKSRAERKKERIFIYLSQCTQQFDYTV